MYASQTNTWSFSQAHEIKENSEQLCPLMTASLDSFFLLSFSSKLWATLKERKKLDPYTTYFNLDTLSWVHCNISCF